MIYLDTYALVEIHNNNPSYREIASKQFIIPELILAEFYGIILRRHNKETADYWIKKIRPYTEKTNFHIFINAVLYRQKHNKEKLSLFDCVGYCSALENNSTFVTGDKAFRNKPHVKFIK